MKFADMLQPLLEFMSMNQVLTVFLVSMAVVGFALYVLLHAIRRLAIKAND